ncbi:hypothetical protein [Chroococcidiopsis sp. CCALA 051]|nr:hypothetical protein [Chroococcidiopsis sp. CCALA 051]
MLITSVCRLPVSAARAIASCRSSFDASNSTAVSSNTSDRIRRR